MQKADIDNENIYKENFIGLYNQLPYDYQAIVLNTFRCLACYEKLPPKGYKPCDIAGLISYHQERLGYSDTDVCNRVQDIIDEIDTTPPGSSLSEDTFRKIKRRNTQSSKRKMDWLYYIAQALKFNSDDYKKYLTEKGLERLAIYSYESNSIGGIYDLLSEKERSALLQLTVSLLKLNAAPEYSTEYLDYENEDTSG